MKRKEFMKILKSQLSGIPKKDANELLEDYEDHFEMGLKKKRKEEEIAKSLGDPKVIAKQIRAEYHIKSAENKKNLKNILRAVYASLGLGFFNVVVVLGPFIGVLAVLLSLFVVSIAVALCGLAAIIIAFVPSFSMKAVTSAGLIFIGIGLIALGILFFIGNCYLSKYIYIGTIKYLKWNARIITGAEK